MKKAPLANNLSDLSCAHLMILLHPEPVADKSYDVYINLSKKRSNSIYVLEPVPRRIDESFSEKEGAYNVSHLSMLSKTCFCTLP